MTWAEALAKEIISDSEFSVSFERFKFDVYGSQWETGKEFHECLVKFLQSEYVPIYRGLSHE